MKSLSLRNQPVQFAVALGAVAARPSLSSSRYLPPQSSLAHYPIVVATCLAFVVLGFVAHANADPLAAPGATVSVSTAFNVALLLLIGPRYALLAQSW